MKEYTRKHSSKYTLFAIETSAATHQSTKDEKDHESPAQHGLAVDITVAHSRHCDQQEIHALPVGQVVRVLEILERITAVLELKAEKISRVEMVEHVTPNEVGPSFHV